MFPFTFKPLGDQGVSIILGDSISPEIHQRVFQVTKALEKRKIPGVIEWVPTYTGVTVYYQIELTSYTSLCRYLSNLIEKLDPAEAPKPDLIRLPTVYGDTYGPDLEYVASYNGITVAEVIRLHSQTSYLVYMIGFVPGFPYLGGMDPRIATPRLENPRLRIPAGSVGIAVSQTGVYPLDTPGGWRIIGQTPVPLYDSSKEIPSLLKAGDIVEFVPIDKKQFLEIKEKTDKGVYRVERVAYTADEGGNRG